MVLNLLAIFVFLAAIIAVIALLWRRLPSANAMSGEAVCLACGTPASQFSADSFLCPVCGRDVRQKGLAAKPPRVLAQPFWWFVAFTAILCVLSLFVTAELRSAFGEVNIIANDAEFWGDGTHTYRLILNANITQAGDKRLIGGELDGDVISAGGNLLTLQIHCPSLRYEVVDQTGREIVPLSQGAFDEPAILRWLAAAELDPKDPVVQQLAQHSYQAMCSRLDVQPAPLPPLNGIHMSGGSSGGYTSIDTAPAALMPACVIGWSIVWVVGTALIFRAPKCNAVRPAAVKETAA